jgi:hypothetical protein
MQLLKLLYHTAEWHAFAKLRMHSDSTLKHLEALTTKLGKLMRNFEKKFAPSLQQLNFRERQRLGNVVKRPETSLMLQCSPREEVESIHIQMACTRRLRPHIRLFGGSDGFSSQIV